MSLECRRDIAAKLISAGERPTTISRITGFSLPTLRKYRTLVAHGGPETLIHLAAHGLKPRLNDEAQSWLVSAVKHSPALHGFTTSIWTGEQVRQLILARFGVQYTASYVIQMIRDWGLGYRLTHSSAGARAPTRSQQRSSDAWVVRRRAAAKMLLAGHAPEHVSDTLNVGLRTVQAYRSALDRDGPDALEQMGRPGRNARLDSGALRRLKAALEKGPMANGIESGLWRNRDVQALIKRMFGIYHSSGYARELVENLGLAHCMCPPKRRTEKKRIALKNGVLEWLAAVVEQPPGAVGIDGNHWNAARLRILLQQRFGVEYSRSYIWEIAIRAGISDRITQRRS